MVRLVKDFEEFTRPLNFVPIFARWSMIALGSAMLSRRVWTHNEAFGYVYPTMYVIFVGRPGLGKTVVINRACEWFLNSLPFPPNYASNCSSPAAFLEEFQAAYKNDPTGAQDHSPLFVRVGELTSWFQDIGGGTFTEFLLSFYDSMAPGEMWKKKLIREGGNLEFPNPGLTLFAATTPDHMKQSRIVESAGTGFISRCIFVCEPEWHDHVSGSPKLDPKLKANIAAGFRNLMGMSGEFVYTEEALKDLEKDIDTKNDYMKEHPGETLMHHFMVRRDLHIKKAAIVIAGFRGSKIIEISDVQDARAMVEDLKENYMYAFGSRIKFHDESLMESLKTKLPKRKITFREMATIFGNDGQALPFNNELSACLLSLKNAGELKITKEDGETYYERV